MKAVKTHLPNIFLFVGALALLGCQTMRPSGLTPQAPKPIQLEMKGTKGAEEITRYHSHARIHDFEGTQKIKEHDEILDFQVSERVTDVKDGKISVLMTTIAKDGTASLHDLAFPERGEEIEFIFSSRGEVLKAGEYSPDSVFFVPPLPLPAGFVQVGDTWTMDHAWVSAKNAVPLGVHLIAILKNLYRCGEKECADIEISGQVEVIGMTRAQAEFSSVVWGRLLVAIEDGRVLWSETRSREKMSINDMRTDVWSCLVGAIEKSGAGVPKKDLYCEPVDKPVELSYARVSEN